MSTKLYNVRVSLEYEVVVAIEEGHHVTPECVAEDNIDDILCEVDFQFSGAREITDASDSCYPAECLPWREAGSTHPNDVTIRQLLDAED